jgi:glucose/arabinose dehydrogenase
LAERVAEAISPDYALGSHVAALGLTAAEHTTLPPPFANGIFIGEHGSGNRTPPVGYRVILVLYRREAVGEADRCAQWVHQSGWRSMGRPVGVAIDKQGALLVADDVGNTAWRVVSAH